MHALALLLAAAPVSATWDLVRNSVEALDDLDGDGRVVVHLPGAGLLRALSGRDPGRVLYEVDLGARRRPGESR